MESIGSNQRGTGRTSEGVRDSRLVRKVNFAHFLQVAICAGADAVRPYGAFVIGLIAALVYFAVSWAMVKVRIDDPLDAVAGI